MENVYIHLTPPTNSTNASVSLPAHFVATVLFHMHLEIEIVPMKPLSIAAVALVLCSYSESSSNNEDTIEQDSEGTAAATCEDYASAFAPVNDLVSYECGDAFLSLTSQTGLPRTQDIADGEDIMVGLTSWIQRVPIPYTYEWRIPLAPAWSNVPIEASAQGPIAVAIDGVPIFHYERRPDVSTALDNYIEENDTVLAGELDQCGGHAGQGDDYHYHYAPVCLLDDHDLTQPIAFGLDGAPVYVGEAGNDYYGNGRFNNLNNFPANLTKEDLDECNAVMGDDGSYTHYSTKTPPYLIGCHHAPFDTALQIEPAPMNGREQRTESPLGGQYGEPASTLVTGFSVSDEGVYTLEFDALDSSGLTSWVIYSQSSTTDTGACWDFEFRVDASQPGELTTACREDVRETLINNVRSIEHNHVH